MAYLTIGLTHPKKFETKTLSTKDTKDEHAKLSQTYDNKVLQAQAELSKMVSKDRVDLTRFAGVAHDLENFQSLHARYRADGFSPEEQSKLKALFRNVGKKRPSKVSPQIKSLFQQLKSGNLKSDEVTEELNWRSSQRYGSVVAQRTGVIHTEERSKLRTALHVPRETRRAVKKKTTVIHPHFPKLIEKTISLFETLDQNQDEIVDRRESRSLLTDYQALGLTPAEATTIYSRQKQLASAIDPETSGEELKMEDLQALLPGRSSEKPSKEVRDVISKVSKRYAHQVKIEQSESAPFKLNSEFNPSKVRQGREGSCWFLCNLPALSEKELSQTIKPEGDDFRVTLNDGRNTLVEQLNEAERRVYSHGDGAWSGLLEKGVAQILDCLLYTSPSPRDQRGSRMPSSA